jgi:hypothetical protein
MPTCGKCGHSMLPDTPPVESIGDLLRPHAWGNGALGGGIVIWFFAAAICSSFMPTPAAGIVGAVIALVVVSFVAWRYIVNFRCPSCGALKQRSDRVQ